MIADIASCRSRIDEIDSAVSALLVERLSLACAAADAKLALGLRVFDAERERSVIERQSHHVVRAIFAAIVNETREYAKRHATEL